MPSAALIHKEDSGDSRRGAGSALEPLPVARIETLLCNEAHNLIVIAIRCCSNHPSFYSSFVFFFFTSCASTSSPPPLPLLSRSLTLCSFAFPIIRRSRQVRAFSCCSYTESRRRSHIQSMFPLSVSSVAQNCFN